MPLREPHHHPSIGAWVPVGRCRTHGHQITQYLMAHRLVAPFLASLKSLLCHECVMRTFRIELSSRIGAASLLLSTASSPLWGFAPGPARPAAVLLALSRCQVIDHPHVYQPTYKKEYRSSCRTTGRLCPTRGTARQLDTLARGPKCVHTSTPLPRRHFNP